MDKNENNKKEGPYSEIMFDKYTLKFRNIILENIEVNPLCDTEPTVKEIKKFYKSSLEDDSNMDNFLESYKKLIEIAFPRNGLILLKFNKKKYYDLFKIKEAFNMSGVELLFIPFIVSLDFKYITLNNEEKKTNIKLKYNRYYEDVLLISECSSKNLKIDSEPLYLGDNFIILKDEKEPETIKFCL